MNQNERRRWLIQALLEEMPQYKYPVFPYTAERQWRLLRSLMNVRPPWPAGKEFLRIQDAFLKEMAERKGVTDAESLPACGRDSRIALWQGEITALACGAVVNAADSRLLGCFSPCHNCVSNLIHTMSGVQLRLACSELMQAQESGEPAGRAKITPGFNLPAKYVLHTVGPAAGDEAAAEDAAVLVSCFRSCLELAEERGLRSVAFCSFSAGDYRFPPELAAETAVRAVREFLEKGAGIRRIVFTVSGDREREAFRRLLEEGDR